MGGKRGTARRVATAIAVPFAAFALAHGMLLAAAYSLGLDGADPAVWSRWDSGHYLSIARGGYEFMSCAEVPGYDPRDWCGNAGWFPLYPALIAPLCRLGARPELAGELVSAVLTLATLALLWNGFLARRVTVRNLLLLLVAAFFPGQVYHHAVFPLSLLTFLSLFLAHGFARERPRLGGLLLGLASTAYPPGVLLTVPAVLASVTEPGRPWRNRLARGAWFAACGAAGLALVFGILQVSTGSWDAFFKVHAKYHHELHNPLTTLAENVRLAVAFAKVGRLELATSVQSLFVAGMVATLLLGSFMRRRVLDRADRFLVLFALVFWLFPLVIGDMNPPRAESTLLPAIALGRHLPAWLPGCLLAVVVPLAWVTGVLFFTGILV